MPSWLSGALRTWLGPATLAYFVAIALAFAIVDAAVGYVLLGGAAQGLPFTYLEHVDDPDASYERFILAGALADLAVYYALALLLAWRRDRGRRSRAAA